MAVLPHTPSATPPAGPSPAPERRSTRSEAPSAASQPRPRGQSPNSEYDSLFGNDDDDDDGDDLPNGGANDKKRKDRARQTAQRRDDRTWTKHIFQKLQIEDKLRPKSRQLYHLSDRIDKVLGELDQTRQNAQLQKAHFEFIIDQMSQAILRLEQRLRP